MTVICDLETLSAPLRRPVLTIGNFDGVHRGHLALFDKVKERAAALDGQSAVMTFRPHPIKIMKPGNGPPLITPTEQKLTLIQDAGIDVVFCINFTRAFAAVTAAQFVEDILVRKIGIKEIVVGYDYTFGRGREGTTGFLREAGDRLGFVVHEVAPVHAGDSLVSSTTIRRLIQEGDLPRAKNLLGRDYQICGTVVSGENRGARLLGFPTANLEPIDELTPKPGVYAVRVLIDKGTYDGVTNIGYNPTFDHGRLSVETHILDFKGDLLGSTIRIVFLARLRSERTFTSVRELAEQIGKDVLLAREIFKTPSSSAAEGVACAGGQ